MPLHNNLILVSNAVYYDVRRGRISASNRSSQNQHEGNYINTNALAFCSTERPISRLANFTRQEPLWLIIPQYCHSHHLVSSLAQLLLRHIPRINLFNNDHFSRLYIGIINFQGIEIETTCNGFTIVISSVPIGRFCPMRVDTRQAVSQFN